MLERLKAKLISRTDARAAALDYHQAEVELAELRRKYGSGEFTGHPEEMLETIEHAERRAQRLKGQAGL